MKQAEVEIVRESRAVSQLIQPKRARILELLAEPDSATGVARRLEMPRQQVNYQWRELEKAGLIEQVAERRKHHLIERLVQATAKIYVISPEVLGLLGRTTDLRDRFSLSYLIAAAGRILRDLATLKERATAVNKKIPTLTMEVEARFEDAQARSAFAEELANAVGNLSAKYHRPEGTGPPLSHRSRLLPGDHQSHR